MAVLLGWVLAVLVMIAAGAVERHLAQRRELTGAAPKPANLTG